MAKLNGNFPKNISEYPNSFKRQGSYPLDAYSIFHKSDNHTALENAKAYAKSDIAYVGQPITVIESTTVDLYIISNEAGDLIKILSTENITENMAQVELHESYLQFPTIGNENTLYTTKDNSIYRWDSTDHKYYQLSSGTVSLDDITIIDGTI